MAGRGGSCDGCDGCAGTEDVAFFTGGEDMQMAMAALGRRPVEMTAAWECNRELRPTTGPTKQ